MRIQNQLSAGLESRLFDLNSPDMNSDHAMTVMAWLYRWGVSERAHLASITRLDSEQLDGLLKGLMAAGQISLAYPEALNLPRGQLFMLTPAGFLDMSVNDANTEGVPVWKGPFLQAMSSDWMSKQSFISYLVGSGRFISAIPSYASFRRPSTVACDAYLFGLGGKLVAMRFIEDSFSAESGTAEDMARAAEHLFVDCIDTVALAFWSSSGWSENSLLMLERYTATQAKSLESDALG